MRSSVSGPAGVKERAPMEKDWARRKVFRAFQAKEKLIYLITDGSLSDEELIGKINLACQAGAGLVQVRDKDRSDEEILDLVQKVKEITDFYQVPLLVDDRVEVAKAAGCGVHLGLEDMEIWAARKLLGPDILIGATAKSIDRALAAEEEGADYLGSGAVYPTQTHVITKITPVDRIRKIADSVKIPVYALGGLTKDNLKILENSHISGICAVSSLIRAEDTGKAVRDLREAIDQVKTFPNMGTFFNANR